MDLATFYENIKSAHSRISRYIRRTPLEHSAVLSEIGKAEVYLKLENEQVTGSFKVRGAFNKMVLLYEGNSDTGINQVVTASSGNHGLACSLAMRTLGLSGKIIVPNTAKPAKLLPLRRTGATVVQHGEDCVEGENYARQMARDEGATFISPYNDYDIIAGQGTISLEILEEMPKVDVVFVAVGGGGLISGIAAALKHINPVIKVIGCSPQQSKVMHESVKKGTIIFEESSETLSDGTAGGIEEGSVTLDMCKNYVDDWVLVSEEEIAKAIYLVLEHHHKVIEGAAGVAVASYLKIAKQFINKKVAIVLCGANISMGNLGMIINKYNI